VATTPNPAPAGAAARPLAQGTRDLIVREEPLLITIGESRLLTMRTPGQDEDLGLGFLLGEGLARSLADVESLASATGADDGSRPDELHVTLARMPDAAVQSRLSRTHEIRSSCGLCGMSDLQGLLDDAKPLLPGTPRLDRAAIPHLLQALAERQPLFAATGGCHGALIAGPDGGVFGHGEDVGRHNALDKALGMAARQGCDFSRAIAVLSGRAGADLVLKCLRVRLPVILSVSAPSALALDLCAAAGATLVGFARGQDWRLYTDSGRMSP
jgi:FdhD protein